MKRIGKPVIRESAVIDRGKALVVTLHPRYLELRRKGTRESYNVTYDACLSLAVKLKIAAEKGAA